MQLWVAVIHQGIVRADQGLQKITNAKQNEIIAWIPHACGGKEHHWSVFYWWSWHSSRLAGDGAWPVLLRQRACCRVRVRQILYCMDHALAHRRPASWSRLAPQPHRGIPGAL